MPFFVKYKLKLRVFDKFCKVVCKYDPPVINKTNKAMFIMMTDKHIYTLNHDIKKLEQRDDERSETYTPSVSDNYYIKDEIEDIPYKMINNIEDFRQNNRELGACEIDENGKPVKRIVKFIKTDII